MASAGCVLGDNGGQECQYRDLGDMDPLYSNQACVGWCRVEKGSVEQCGDPTLQGGVGWCKLYAGSVRYCRLVQGV